MLVNARALYLSLSTDSSIHSLYSHVPLEVALYSWCIP